MRTFGAGSALLLAAALAAGTLTSCDGSSLGPGPARPDAGPLYAVTGRLVDTLSGAPVVQAAVTVGDTSVLSDSGGAFTVRVPRSLIRVLVLHPEYEPASFKQQVSEDLRIRRQMRPYAPTVVACDWRNDTLVARVVDLESRKLVVRRDSSIVAIGPRDAPPIRADHWRWIVEDIFTWRVEIPMAGEVGAPSHWRIFDAAGHTRVQTCHPQPF